MRHPCLSGRRYAICCSLLLLPLLIASPLQARLSLTDVNNRVLDLEKADQDALGGQLIVDAVTIETGSPGAGVVIVGVNFDNGAAPVVTLGGVALTAVSVSLDGETITATLDQAYLPGSYNLTVETGLARTQFDAAMVTVGAVGPEGPEGPEGPQGIQGPPGPDEQTLSLDGTVLTISGGNAVDLSALVTPTRPMS